MPLQLGPFVVPDIRGPGTRPAHEWEQRWANEKLADEYRTDNDPVLRFGRYAGRWVTQGYNGSFHLIPRHSMIGLTSSQPAYVLALPHMLMPTFDFPPVPEIAR